MKKLLIAALIGGIMLMSNCDNEPEEANPYPDGVYPFEVSDVSHTQTNIKHYRKFTITWTNPVDSGFSRAHITLFHNVTVNEIPEEEPLYSSITDKEIEDADILGGWWGNIQEFILGENSFSYNTYMQNDKFVIIKCVDRFGNISKGVRYEYSWKD